MASKKLKILDIEEYETLGDKEPDGIYDRDTREQLYWIIEKLKNSGKRCSRSESRLLKRFDNAAFGLLLSENRKTRGPINFPGTVCIEGHHDGDVVGESLLVIAEKGSLNGNVSTGTVICNGKIVGDVSAAQQVTVSSTGFLVGNVTAPCIQIDEGAMFKGKCQLGYPSENGSSESRSPVGERPRVN